MTVPVLDPRPGLPVCENSGLQRLWCPMDCCGTFTMTSDEYALYHGGNVTTIRHLEQVAARPLPQYRARYNTWRVPEPKTTHCDHATEALCQTCEALLDNLLADLPYLVHELGIAARKAQHFAPRGNTRQRRECPTDNCAGTMHPTNEQWKCATCGTVAEFESALPYNNGASTELRRINQMMAERHDDRRALLTIMSRRLEAGHKVIERPDNMLYLGACPTCNNDLYAERGDTVDCDLDCGYRTTWAAHHEHLLDQLEDRLMTMAEVVTLYQAAGQPITRRRVQWIIESRHVPVQRLTMARWHGALGMRTEPIAVIRLGDFRTEHARKKAG